MISSRLLDMAFSVAMALLGLYIAGTALGLGTMTKNAPAPGFFPLGIGLGMTVLSAWNILRALRASGRLLDIERGEAARVLLASAMMLAFIGLAYLTGMLAAIFMLMMGVGALFGPRSAGFRLRLLVLSLAMTGVIHLIFQRLLDVPAL